jgi:hypothetical protein
VQLQVSPRQELAGALRLFADPWTGFAPLHVSFNAFVPSPGSSTFDWTYGDGATERSTSPLVTHMYAESRPQGYDARVVTGSSSTNVLVYPMPSPGHTPYAENFFMVHFTSGALYRRSS